MKRYLKKKTHKNTLENISKSKTKKTYEDVTARIGRKESSALDDDYDDDEDDDTEHDADAATLPLRQCATSLFWGESETRIVK